LETFAILLGACCVVPIAIVLTIWLVSIRKRLQGKRLAILLAIIWVPVVLATISELWWMFVEEPRRIAAGEPVE